MNGKIFLGDCFDKNECAELTRRAAQDEVLAGEANADNLQNG